VSPGQMRVFWTQEGLILYWGLSLWRLGLR